MTSLSLFNVELVHHDGKYTFEEHPTSLLWWQKGNLNSDMFFVLFPGEEKG